MRTVTYECNGKTFKTYAEKVAYEAETGLSAQTKLNQVSEDKGELTPIRAEMLAKYGVVFPIPQN